MRPKKSGRLQKSVKNIRLGLKIIFWGGLCVCVCLLTGWFVWSQGEWAAKRLMSVAEEKLDHNDYLGAIQDYDRVIETYAKSRLVSEAYYWKGLVSFLYLDDSEKAVSSFKKVIEKETALGIQMNNISALGYLAEIFEKKLDRPLEAIASYEEIIARSTDSVQSLQIRYKIGEIYFAMGDMAQARVEWDLLVENGPTSSWAPAALYRKGGSYFVTGACTKAVQIYKELFTDYPDNKMSGFAKFRAANCFEIKKQPAEALELYKELEGNYPDQGLIQQKVKTLNEFIQAAS